MIPEDEQEIIFKGKYNRYSGNKRSSGIDIIYERLGPLQSGCVLRENTDYYIYSKMFKRWSIDEYDNFLRVFLYLYKNEISKEYKFQAPPPQDLMEIDGGGKSGGGITDVIDGYYTSPWDGIFHDDICLFDPDYINSKSKDSSLIFVGRYINKRGVKEWLDINGRSIVNTFDLIYENIDKIRTLCLSQKV